MLADRRSGAPHVQCIAVALLMMSCSSAYAQEQPSPQTPPPQGGEIPRQEESTPQEQPVQPERWNLFYQATSIGQYHGTFRSPYASQFSLQDYPERDVSLTTTLFLGLRLEKNTVFYFDP